MKTEVNPIDHTGQRLALEGITLYYEIHGVSSGIPLFVLHGGPGFDHSYLEVSAIWQELGAYRPVIFYDQRGNGRSSRLTDGQSCTLDNQVSDLHALQEHLGFAQIDLLGHSWGGFLAMTYSARHPQRVRKMILVESTAPKLNDTVLLFAEVFPDVLARRNALQSRVELGEQEAIRANMREYFSMLCYSEQKRDAFLSMMDSFTYRSEVNKMLWADAAQFDLGPELAKFQLPTLVINGRYDMNVAPIVAFKIKEAIADSRIAIFEQSGHLPFFEEPELFMNTVDTFLRG